MKPRVPILLSLATLGCFVLLLAGCGRSDAPGASDTKRLSTDETRQVAMHILLNRYPKAEIASESTDGQTARYRFTTNGVMVPSVVVVDRHAGKAHFETVGN